MPGSWPPQTPSPSPPPPDRTPHTGIITPPRPPPVRQDVLAKRASILYTTVCILFCATLLFCFWPALAIWRVRPGQEPAPGLLPSTGEAATATTSCPCHRLPNNLDSGCHVSPNTEEDDQDSYYYCTSPSGRRWRRDEPMILEACGLLADMMALTGTASSADSGEAWREILLGSGGGVGRGETAAHTGKGDDKPEEPGSEETTDDLVAQSSHKDSSSGRAECSNKEAEALWAASDRAFALKARALVLLADGRARDMYDDVVGSVEPGVGVGVGAGAGAGAGRTVFGDVCDANRN